MLDYYKLITVSHRSLNTQDLEHFIIRYEQPSQLTEQLQSIKEATGQDEILYLATCNRVVFFFYGAQEIDESGMSSFFRLVNRDIEKTTLDSIDRFVTMYQGIHAVNHLFGIASSIDSLVVGEREIFRQFRDAYALCSKANLCGDHIRLVDKMAVKAAKEVYTKTTIGTRPVSVVSLAIQKFLSKGLPVNAKILLIGAGETNGTVGRFLRKHGYENILIFNRSIDNAKSLSAELNAEARHLGDLKEYNEGFDCIFTCTSSQEPILTKKIFSSIVQDSEEKVIVDLSIPHNVGKEVIQLDQADYISIDDLRQLAEQNLAYRSGNIAEAKTIIGHHLTEFEQLFERRKVEKALSNLPKEIQEVKNRAINLVFKDQIEDLPPETKELIEEIATYMEKKCVAIPMKLAKKIVQ